MKRADAGFTLIEMLIAVVIMGLIMAALSSATMLALRFVSGSEQGVTDSAGAQLLVSYFVSDAQAADQVQPTDFTCGSGALLELRDRDADPSSNKVTSVLYALAAQPAGGAKLVREVYSFTNSATSCPTTPETSSVLVADVDPSATVRNCDGSTTCTDSSRQIGLKVTAALTTSTSDSYTPYSFAVSGTRRTS